MRSVVDREARLAERDVHVAVTVGAVLDLAALELADGLADVGGHRSGLRVRHEAARAEHTTELADHRHEIGSGDRDVEVEHALFDVGGEVVRADEVSAGGARLCGGFTRGEDGDPNVLAGARRQRDRAPHDLIGLAWVDAEAHCELDRLVELRRRQILREAHGLIGRIQLVSVETLRSVDVSLAFRH